MNFSTLQQRFANRWPDMRLWLNQFSSRLAECGILVLVVFTLEVGLLFLCSGLWAVYIETQVGRIWLADHRQLAQLIVHVLGQDKLELSLTVMLLSLKHLGIIGLAAQLSLLLRFFYLSQGPLNRVLFLGIPLAGLNALILNQSLQTGFSASMVLVIFPTLALMHHSLMLIANTIPEADELCKPLLRLARKQRQNPCEQQGCEAEGGRQAEPAAIIRLEDDPQRPGITRAVCGHCRQRLTYPAKYAGRKVECRNCQTAFVLP